MFLFLGVSPVAAEGLKDVYEQAVDAYNKSDFERASNIYQNILQYVPNFVPAYYGLGLIAQRVSTEEEAIHYFKLAVQYNPQYAPAYENLGRIYHRQQNNDEAIAMFKQALKADPTLAGPKIHLGWMYLMTKAKPRKAIYYFQQVVNSPVGADGQAYYGLGLSFFADNQREKALDVITTLHRIGSEDLAARLEQAVRESPRVFLQQPQENVEALPATPSAPLPLTTAEVAQSQAPSPTPITPTKPQPKGIKVRLRDNLEGY